MIDSIPVNSIEAIQTRLEKGKLPRFGPFFMLAARPLLALAAQGIWLVLFIQLQVPNASVAVRNWWSVYGTLVDLGCLGLLILLTRREGIKLRDLIGFVKNKIKTDIPLGFGIIIVLFPVAVIGGGMLAKLIAYGSLDPVFPEAAYIRTLPLLAALYSRILWWPLWSVTEELTYNGYALPRLKVLTKSSWISVAIVCFFWSIQHSFLPWINLQHAFYLFLMFVPLTIGLQLVYLKVRRLTPLIIGHWMMDLISALMMIQIL